MADLKYQSGFGNEFATESIPGALPIGRNSPQQAPMNLYAEQLSGAAFTAKRHENLRSWQYRIQPSVVHGEFRAFAHDLWRSAPLLTEPTPPSQMRWSPLAALTEEKDFITGTETFAANGDALQRQGSAVHLYRANQSMEKKFFYNADGDLLIVPQQGKLVFHTEFGRLAVEPAEIIVIPRGVKFQVHLEEESAAGYICEIYGHHLTLPYLGPIGANGLANPRDFLAPVACYEKKRGDFQLIAKFGGRFWEAAIQHSPLDVVAWHGNYYPYKYDLRRFNTIGTVSFDHPDPSIFTVLTSPTDHEGLANVDFVIFPPRWMVATDTFRPPYFHRNIMSEFMGLIHGVYDAKPAGGFEPGGSSLHNCMSAHGPEAAAFAAASQEKLAPKYLAETLAFMFESSFVYQVTPHALSHPARQKNYLQCWQGLPASFSEKR